MTTTLSNLPVRLSIDGNNVVSQYIRERHNVGSPKDLQKFVSRWRHVWRLPEIRRENLPYYDKLLASGHLKGRTLRYTYRQLSKAAAHDKNRTPNSIHWKLARSVLLPSALLRTSLLARKFCCPEDVVLDHLFGERSLSEYRSFNRSGKSLLNGTRSYARRV